MWDLKDTCTPTECSLRRFECRPKALARKTQVLDPPRSKVISQGMGKQKKLLAQTISEVKKLISSPVVQLAGNRVGVQPLNRQ